jgi:hypothetical protein
VSVGGRAALRVGFVCAIGSSLWGCYQGLPDQRPAIVGDTGDTDAFATPWGDGESSTGEPGTFDTFGESSTGEDEPEDAEYMGALHITPVGLHVNQGVAVALAENGTPIVETTRSAPVVHGRRTLVYGTWTLNPEFVSRAIRGELHLLHADGTEETLVSVVFVDGPSGPNPSDPHFEWMLEPDQLPEGTRWFATLHELEPVPDGSEPLDAPSLPATGTAAFDHGGDQKLRMVFVPYRHQRSGCDKTAPHDVATIDAYRQLMEMTYPTQEVEITVHPVRVFTANGSTLDGLLTDLLDLRAAEQPAPDVYYFGSIDSCEEPAHGGLGYVPFNPDTLEDAPWRVSVGAFYDWAPDFSLWTMVHEVGHNHGRDHVACAGNEGTTDPDYPVAGGAIGVMGWGIHDGEFRPGSATDYMTYCFEELWASSYAWWRTFDVIDALTAAVGSASLFDPDAGTGAVVLALRDGEVTTARHVPNLRPRHGQTTARWNLRDGRTRQTIAQRDRVPDSDAHFLTVAVPDEGMNEILTLDLQAEDGTHTIVPRHRIRTRP